MISKRFPAAQSTVFRTRTSLFLVALAVLSLFPGSNASFAEPPSQDQTLLADQIMELMRQDDRDQALPLCQTYNEQYPGDQIMLYNQACLENTAGLKDEAITTFTLAVNAGFDDFSRALDDPDLQDLKYHPAMVELALENQIRLTSLATSRAVDLVWQETSAAVRLPSEEPGPGSGAVEDAPEMDLTWTPAGLDLVLRAAGAWSSLVAPDMLAPWNGGPGLVVTLGLPTGSEGGLGFRTDNHFLFAFGTEKGRPAGALFLAAQNRWQIISELQPKIRLTESNHLELKALIPWAGILPYDPVVDARMGFNAAVRIAGPEGGKMASVLPDPAAFRPNALERRIVPLNFRVESVAEEIFAGKVSRTISGAKPITVDLIAVSDQRGPGRLTIDFLGGPDQSLLPGGQANGAIDLVPGLNNITRQADFTALKTGAYVVKAQLDFPSGRTQTWGASVLQLAPGWSASYRERIEVLPAQEKPTAEYHLTAIEEAVAAHPPRRGPGAIITALDELGRLLDNADKNGSILPDKGSFVAVYTGPDGDPRLCHAYLPGGWKIAKKLNPVITLTAVVAMTGAIADRMGQNYEQGRQKSTLKAGTDGGFPIYLVPVLAPSEGSRPADLIAHYPRETEACLDWARETFGVLEVSVTGADRGAAAALQTAISRPEALKALLIFAGRDLDPWPQADSAFIRDQLAGFPRDLAVTWADFVHETNIAGQGPAILQALKDLDGLPVEVQTVRGGMNFTQVADRTVLWAEGLR